MRAWALATLLVLALGLAGIAGGAAGLSPDGGESSTDRAKAGALTAGVEVGPATHGVEASGVVEAGGGPFGVAVQGGDVDQVVMEAHLEPDGSAAWRIEHRIRLDDTATAEGFEETRSQIETDPGAVLEDFTERVRAMATTAEEQTGRVMVVENSSVTAHREQLPQEYGIVVYEFRWYGFAATDGGLRAGDALDGLFLDDETTLLVSWPENTTLAEVSPEPDDQRDGAVVWEGPLEFATGEPTVVLESEMLSFGPDLGWDVSNNDVFVTLAAVVLLVGLVGTGGLTLRRRLADEEGAAAGAAGGAAASNTQLPEELLSNEERVLGLLEERGGRIKQQDVVEALDWSETKTSEVVSDLRETDQIEVYRLGRNNVLALPETGLGYEFDDDGGENG